MNKATVERVSIEEVRKMWNTGERTYTDQELHGIRDWMYKIKGLIIESWHRSKARSVKWPKNKKPPYCKSFANCGKLSCNKLKIK